MNMEHSTAITGLLLSRPPLLTVLCRPACCRPRQTPARHTSHFLAKEWFFRSMCRFRPPSFCSRLEKDALIRWLVAREREREREIERNGGSWGGREGGRDSQARDMCLRFIFECRMSLSQILSQITQLKKLSQAFLFQATYNPNTNPKQLG